MNWTAWKAGFVGALFCSILAVSSPGPAWGQAQTCNGILTVDYVTGANFAVPGDILRVRLNLGTGSINGGTALTIQRLRFDLDCNSNFALGLPCTDEGAFVEYEGDGTITTTCGVTFSTGHPVSSAPNEVVFTPNVPIVIPANQAVPPGFCNVEFDIKVLASPSIDSTPNFIEEVEGYKNTDAACDNGVLASGGQQSSDIPLCPVCTNTECTTSSCNQMTGQCVPTNRPNSTPCGDTDQNACTAAGCEAGQCVQTHQTTVCTPDSNDCTNDPACDPQTGMCLHPPKPDSTPCGDTDQNACTIAGCEAGQCVQTHQTTVCNPDTNPCTQDPACNPQNGLCEHPPVPDSSPCPDTDQNACTSAGCEQGSCVQSHLTTPCPPDNNECTNDLACDPGTGLCPHPPKPDSTPCTDSDGNACTAAGCEQGSCVQAHQTTVCPPDTNPCTQDPACNPQTGQCTHPPAPDSTPCADTDANQCTAAGCEQGQCVQSHVEVCNTPDHFVCYEVKPKAFTPIGGVSVIDTFGTHTETVRFPHRLCAPADKRDEDPSAPTHPDHLMGYIAKGTSVKVPNQTIVNQFGTIKLDVVRPDVLLVPTLKSLTADPGPLANPAVDHFQCYKVKRTKGAPRFVKIPQVKADDQFGTAMLDLLKPARLCVPANKNGEDPTAPQHLFSLLCYKTKNSAFGTVQTFTHSQFGPDQPLLIHRRELCVPSQLNPPPPTTSTSTVATTSTTSTTAIGSPSGAFDENLQ